MEVPNFVNLSTWWEKYNPGVVGRAMPYGWGTYGIAYRADLVDKPVTSFAQLFTPARTLQGKIIMSPQALELVPVALKTLGYSMWSQDPRELDAAEVLLKSQKPYVYRYEALLLTEKSALLTGAAHAAMTYSGDAAALQAFNKNVHYVEADEGQILWFDYWAVLASSTQKKLAYQFLDFLQQPEVNARNVEAIYTATFNEKALAFLSEETKNNPAVFPTMQPDASYFVKPDTRHIRKIMSIWHELNIR
jgi:spermidine/putrescine transport system substrate-binding protein